MRTFTLAEANRMLPRLESLLQAARKSNQELKAVLERLQQIGHHVFLSGGSLLKLTSLWELKQQRDEANGRLRAVLTEIDSLGVQVKDLEIGLLDFPCQVEGEIVLLCWKLGEPAIAYWHTVEAGFQGRQPIDDRISGSKPKPS